MKIVTYGLLSVMFVLSITNAYSGEWRSLHHDINIKFNDKIWSIIETNDEKGDTLVAFFDKSDGATFYIRIEYLKNAKDIDNSLIAETISEGLYNSDPNLEVKNHQNLRIASNDFYTIDYVFNNKKFGPQLIRHAFVKKENYIVILLMSWPKNMQFETSNIFPLKHTLLLQGLKL